MIAVKDLTYSYPSSSINALDGLNFKIEKGEIFGFLGPSGAGKSTCQKVLYKILDNYSGSVQVDGKNLKDWGKSYFEIIGVGFELPNHYPKLTARENLELFAAFYPKEKLLPIPEILTIVGLENVIDDRVESFSKGMQMRLNYVRAIMHDPEILFFDEPTAGLDPMNARKIINHIKALREAGKTIFITTHNMTTADELCDRISFIVDGQIVLTDQPQKLKIQYGDDRVRVELKNGQSSEFPLSKLGVNNDFLKFIREHEVQKIHTSEATLEKVFLQVTGKSLDV
ncbi:MAG: ABC transporter ATP-binding protein [Bacteroidia bacterium]|nr:ABC transporter ATP-binding protein [Bacteroidia bacterium]